jgi:hypothetical protein
VWRAQVLEMADQDVDIASIIGENSRMQLYEQHVAEQLASGSGTVDAHTLIDTLPERLQIDASKAKRKAQELAKGKVRPTLTQAIAHYRKKEHGNAVKYLNNLLACVRVNEDAGKGLQWNSRKELVDVYGLFCSGQTDEQVRSEMATALGLSDEEQTQMLEAVASGAFESDGAVAREEREPESFF